MADYEPEQKVEAGEFSPGDVTQAEAEQDDAAEFEREAQRGFDELKIRLKKLEDRMDLAQEEAEDGAESMNDLRKIRQYLENLADYLEQTFDREPPRPPDLG